MSILYLIRHGETTWVREGKHTGLTDLPLTPLGVVHAKKLGERLDSISFSKIYASPLKRALETCRIAGFTPVIDHDLVEWDYGRYEGLTTEEIQQKKPGWNLFSDGVEGGESLSHVAARADRFLQKVASTQGEIAIFSSGHFMRVLAARWIGLEGSAGKLFQLSAASLSILGHERETNVIVLWNDISHLVIRE